MARPKRGSLEERVLVLVRDNYPITKVELRKLLKVPMKRLYLSLKRLEGMGYIGYDILPDKVYIRLNVIPMGPRTKRSKDKAKKKKKKKKKRKGEPSDMVDYSYM